MPTRAIETSPKQSPWTRRGGLRPRLLAVLIGLSPFLLLEVFLQAAGYGSDSFGTFVADRAFFVQEGGLVSLASERRSYMRTRPFTAEKPAGTTRIIVVGDSSAFGFTHAGNCDEQGNPVVLSRPYPVLLQESLKARYPGERLEVINCGACGCGTFRLKGLVREVLQFSPDVLIFMAGSSEFLESRLFKDWEQVRGKLGFLWHFKTLALARDLLRKIRMGTEERRRTVTHDSPFLPVLEEDVVRGPYEVEALLEHSQWNLAEIVNACREISVPLVLCTVPSSLRVPPGAMLHHMPKAEEIVLADVPREQTARFLEAYHDSAALVDAGKFEEALDLLEPARRQFADDPRISGLYYITARAFEGLEDWKQARFFYVLAKDRDPYIWRALSGFNEIIRELAGEPGVYLEDLEISFELAVPDGIPDRRLFFDRNHPREVGHALIARELTQLLESKQLVSGGR